MDKRCLCCEKFWEGEGVLHPACLKRLFGSPRAPDIPFDLADLPRQIIELGNRTSISGVQIKASVRLNAESWKLEIVSTGGTHILKPEPGQFPDLPQNENLCINIAEEMGLPVPPHGLFPMADKKLCYVIKRFDRLEDGTKLQKETLYQILQSRDKYLSSLEAICRAIRTHATNVGLDSIDFFERALLCFLIGNGDMHLKNWALLIKPDKTIALAPCYDFICSKIYLPRETESALTLNGKENNLSRSDFEALAKYLTIDPKAIKNTFDKYEQAKDKILEMCVYSRLNPGLKNKLVDIVKARYKRLYGKNGK